MAGSAGRGALAGVAAVVTALLASACCIGPVALAVLGLGGAAFATRFEPYRPYFLALTAAFLGVGFWIAYRPRKRAIAAGAARRAGAVGPPDEDCCDVGAVPALRSRTRMRALLWVSTILAAGAAAFPYVAESGARADRVPEPTASEDAREAAHPATDAAFPFACNLGAMDEAQRARHAALGQALRSRALGMEELEDGFAFRFAPEPALCADAAEFIALERLCCPFLDLGVGLERNGGPLWLRMTGPPGVKPFLRAELELAAPQAPAALQSLAPQSIAPHSTAHVDSLDLTALRDEFNRASDAVRVVAILSPT